MSKNASEKDNKRSLLPHYYRLITAWVTTHILIVIIALEIVVLSIACIFLFVVYLEYTKTKIERSKQVILLETWENAIERHPTYPQAYYNAALYAARLGDSQKAVTYVEKALSLNENYEPAKQLKKLLVE
ncbi:MAG: tetratricopeptide repeat protein [Candidatus Levybacteria bacterium]|nr:tetratricopeptide repeat protein [Candidatus Levybacteria bacterium]